VDDCGPIHPGTFPVPLSGIPFVPDLDRQREIVEPEDTGAIGDVHVFLVFLNTYPRIMEWSG